MIWAYSYSYHFLNKLNCIGSVMVSVLALSVVDYKMSICCFSAKNSTSRNKSRDWLAQNQSNASEWSDMSTHRLLFQWASTINIQLLVYYKTNIIIISSNVTCSLRKIAHLALNNNHWLQTVTFMWFYNSFIIPSPTKLRRDIVTLPSVFSSFRSILVNTLGSTSFNGF